ncbi:MAG: ABC transporter permease [Gemmatimonadaceae bacterium]|nr:ABC transporter permease [Gemmatimonadaceae bacterium]
MDRKLWAVIKREYLERVRSKWFLVGTLIVPALVVATFLLPAYMNSRGESSDRALDILILDASGTGLGERVRTTLLADPAQLGASTADTASGVAGGARQDSLLPQVQVVPGANLAAAEAAATQAVIDKRHVGYLVLDTNTVAGAFARYAGRNATTAPDMDRVRAAVRQAVMVAQLQRAGADPAMVNAITRTRVQMPAERITDKGKGGSAAAGAILGLGIAFVLYLAIILHGQNVLRSVLDEKTTRVAEVVISSVKPSTLLAGKVLGVGAVGLTQQIVWIVLSAYLIQKLLPFVMRAGGPEAAALAGGGASGFLLALTGVGWGTLALLLAYFLIGFVFYAAIYAAIGAMVSSEQEAQQAAVPVMFLLIGTFLFVSQVMMQPEGTIARVLGLLPFSSPIIMPMRMTIIQPPMIEIVASLVIGIVSCVVVVWLAARIYRVGMLMYGKRPSLRELARWIRTA